MFITKPKAIALLEKAVASRGADEVVNICTYSRGTVPNCIVGQVLYYIDPAILERIDEKGEQHADATFVLTDESILGDVKFSQPALRVLSVAQLLQDGRDYDREYGGSTRPMPWGETLEKVKAL